MRSFKKQLGLSEIQATWIMGDLDFWKFGHKLDQTCFCFLFHHGRARNIFGYCRAINILGHGRGFFTCLQFALLAIWATWTLGDLSFGWLELWVTWALGDLSFDDLGNLDIWQFRWLGHWTIWVSSTLGNLCSLFIGKFVYCKFWLTLWRLKVFSVLFFFHLVKFLIKFDKV